MSENTAPIRLRARLAEGYGELRMLFIHPMESGLRKDAEGRTIPAHHITLMNVAVNGRRVIRGELGPGIAANPLFAFQIEGAKAADLVEVSWEDNLGQRAAANTRFA